MKLESQGVLRKDEPVTKKMKRAGSVEPMEKPESPLPELPGNLQQKQVPFFFFLTIHVFYINTHAYVFFFTLTSYVYLFIYLFHISRNRMCRNNNRHRLLLIKTKLSLSQRMSEAKNKGYIFTPFFHKFVDMQLKKRKVVLSKSFHGR